MKTAIVNFNTGEVTPKIDARSDTEKHVGGCRQSDNMIPSIFGGSERRPGTELITNNGAFNSILAALIAHENIELCWENTPLVTDFDTLLSQITCHENDILCYENEVMSDVALPFLARALCHENELLFHEGEVLYV